MARRTLGLTGTPPGCAAIRTCGRAPGWDSIAPMGELARRSRGIAALIVAAVALVGGGAGAACRYTSLDCHIRSDDGWDLRNVQAQRGGPVTIAASLAKTQVVGRLDLPTDFDFLPDGRILVATRDGLIQLVDPRTGAIAPRPVLDLRDDVSTREFRGLVALVVKPGSTGPTRFYVVYALRNGPKAGPTAKGPTTARVSRFTLRGNIADRDSERIIIGRVAGGSCTEQQASDCLPSEVDHIGADILFRDDGTLLIATGDGGPGDEVAQRAQDVDTLGGKLLRVDANGRGLPDNPYWDGNPNANRSKVWARGLRNPFRLAALPDGSAVVGDVGETTVEELNIVERDADYGWPCFEGGRRTAESTDLTICGRSDEGTQSHRPPWIALPHPKFVSVTGGVALTDASALPRSFRSKYVFADWVSSTVFATDLPVQGERLRSLTRLRAIETGTAGPVRFRVGPDGALYELSLNTGDLWRIAAHKD